MPQVDPDHYRPFPAAVFVPEHTLRMIADRVAKLPEERREKEVVILVRSGRYRANTDQVILYQHESRLPNPKADLIEVLVCKVEEIPADRRSQMRASQNGDEFLMYMRRYWDESLEADSSVTLLACRNLRGALIDKFIDMNEFHNTLPQFGQE